MYVAFSILHENSREQLKALIAELAAKKDNAPGSAAQKIGDLYNIAMDSVKLNQEGVAPIKAELAAIDNRRIFRPTDTAQTRGCSLCNLGVS